ncbi:MAG: cell division protein FtsQ/DivIB [Anaerolineae bacterium]|nr:cell division protein FtsQ/DivIB [Anaerolineae bacterium]
MAKQRKYYRTVSLLRAQPQTGQRPGLRIRIRPQSIPWPFVAVLCIALVFVVWVWKSPGWYISPGGLVVQGASQATVQEIVSASELLGLHSLWVRSDEVTERIVTEVEAVTEAEIQCKLYPAECFMIVNERKPVMVWVADTVTYWVDNTGVMFTPLGERSDLPVLKGPVPEDKIVSPAVFESLRALSDAGISIEGLAYDPVRGLIWIDPEGRRVAFGTGADMEQRWYIYEALVSDLESRKIFPWVIDVRFPSAPTYSLERSW